MTFSAGISPPGHSRKLAGNSRHPKQLVIALTFAQASAQDVLELAGIVAGGGLVRQIEVALDDVVDVLQDHRSRCWMSSEV